MSFTEMIKEAGLDLGFSKVGITSADDFPEYIDNLNSRSEMYAFYMEDPRKPLIGARPRSLMPSARSIISLAYDFSYIAYPEKLVGKIGRIYQARCYNPPADRLNGARIRLFKEFLRRQGCEVGEGIIVPDRLAAARAGVTTYGKNNFAYVDGIGSFVCLSSIVVDKELEYDAPTVQTNCPEHCQACLKACPTGALYEPLKLNPHRCVAFNNWFTQDGKPAGLSSYIPLEIREKIGTKIHGCDICQEVCPRNKKRLAVAVQQDPYLEKIAEDFDLVEVLNMSDVYFQRIIQPLMYNYIQEKKYFQRNAAIALGNTRDSGYVDVLEAALKNEQELVRSYAAWALGRIGGAKALAALEASIKYETSAMTIAEIKTAINRLQPT